MLQSVCLGGILAADADFTENGSMPNLNGMSNVNGANGVNGVRNGMNNIVNGNVTTVNGNVNGALNGALAAQKMLAAMDACASSACMDVIQTVLSCPGRSVPRCF
eukprot:6317755-Amphidinium_carterae.1